METFWQSMDKNCLFIPRFAFRCLGISVNSNESTLYKGYSVLMVLAAFLYPWNNLHALLNNLDNFDAVSNGVFNGIGGSIAFLKIMVILINRKRLEMIFSEIERIQDERNTEEWSKKEIYNTNRKVLVILVIYYLALGYFYVATLAGRIFNNDRSQWKMPISHVSTVNITYSPNFELAWAYQVAAVTIISSAYCVTNFLVAALIVDLAVQFKIFQRKIKRMFGNTQGNVNENEAVAANWNDLHHLIKYTVRYHLSLIDLSNKIEKVCSYLIFLDVVGSLCIICFALYTASVVPLLDMKAMESYLEVGLITGSLFFVAYCGTEISSASESIGTACFEANFIGTDVRFQKSLQMIILRSQKPVKLTVGGFADLSITVFVWILRSTYTYFMVLRKGN